MKLEWPYYDFIISEYFRLRSWFIPSFLFSYFIWKTCIARITYPPLELYRQDPKEDRLLHLRKLWLQELPESCSYWQQRTSGNHSRFSVCIYFHRLYLHLNMIPRQRRFKTTVLLPLDRLTSWAVEFHQPNQMVMRS